MKVKHKWLTQHNAKVLPRLELELLHQGLVHRRLGILVLMTGILLTLTAAAYYVYTIRQISILEASIARSTNTIVANNTPINDEEAKAVQEAISHLDLSWGTLFTALEAVTTEKISLISVEPDTNQGTVKIIAESLNAYDMLEYVRTLSKQPTLHNVLLTEYEVKGNASEQPMRFTLTAIWERSL